MAYKDHIVKIRHTYFVSNDAQLSVHAPTSERLGTWKGYFQDENTSWRTRDLSTDAPFESMAGSYSEVVFKIGERNRYEEMLSEAEDMPHSFKLRITEVPDKLMSRQRRL